MKSIILISLCVYAILLFGCETDSSNKKLKGNFLGSPEPGDSALIFAPGLVSNEFNVRDAAFSPDGGEFFYSIRGSAFHSILNIRKENDVWNGPEVASFSGQYSDIEPCFSPDGKRLYFVSNRPLEGTGEPKDYDIWYVEKENDKWGDAKNLGAPINTAANEFYPSFNSEGTLYFCANYETGIGGEDLYYSKLIDGNYQRPVNMGDSVNSARDEFNSFVSPDGSFIMFTSTGWGRGFGGGDLWISFRKNNNEWTEPRNMGEKVNTPFFEYCPSLTHDGRFLFFTSNKSSDQKYSSTHISYEEIISDLRSTLNGSQNIYWISAGIIENLR